MVGGLDRLTILASRSAWIVALSLASLTLLGGCALFRSATPMERAAGMRASINDLIADAEINEALFDFPRGTALDTLRWDDDYVEVVFSEHLSRRALRPSDVSQLAHQVERYLGPYLADRKVSILSLGVPVAELVPNIYRDSGLVPDSSRVFSSAPRGEMLVRNLNREYAAPRGLDGYNIALWPSHGWYYDNTRDIWRWQRLRMFQTVEDLLTVSFAVSYLTPMLENAGAQVFLPRERDPQPGMAVVDNDSSGALRGKLLTEGLWAREGPGFGAGRPPYSNGHNPFLDGTYDATPVSEEGNATAKWTPDIPQQGSYAVYVSYGRVPDAVADAEYTVYHAGGETRFSVNQTIGAGTWVYLGTFDFAAGMNPDNGAVVLSNRSAASAGRVTADAVRFGGGRGLISRNGSTGGRPRYVEGARYHLQYSGLPDTLVYDLHEGADDYRDDYQSRGEWVNYMRGAPFGPNRDRSSLGLGIPIDVSLAMHTDAGTVGRDSTIGTLAIYSLEGADSTLVFPNGVSRFANRDLADIVQTQFVEDLRALHDSTFSRRSLLEAQYSEAFRPNVPALLLELLSHQNPEDARLYSDPRVRFDASRAIYKGILRFLASQNGFDPVVQPLPVTHMAAVQEAGGIRVSWRPSADPLEPTADADYFVLYTRIEEGGWDNGRRTESDNVLLRGLPADTTYSFRVTAANAGGQSFPSETLSVRRSSGAVRTALIVNGFDRVAPPEFLDVDSLRGVAFFADQGVPHEVDYSFTGYQFNFNDRQVWRSDDSPYHGASHADFDTVGIAGNTFDFPYVHGASLSDADFSFDSVSDEAVFDGSFNLSAYDFVDLILGEEQRTGFVRARRAQQFEALPRVLRQRLSEYLQGGGRLFVSGAHFASELMDSAHQDATAKVFADSVLHLSMITTHGSRRGGVYASEIFAGGSRLDFSFNTEPSPVLYAAEGADALKPVGVEAETLLRYSENNLAAGIGYRGNHRVVSFGFPFEVITSRSMRAHVMRMIVDYLFTD